MVVVLVFAAGLVSGVFACLALEGCPRKVVEREATEDRTSAPPGLDVRPVNPGTARRRIRARSRKR